MSIMRKLLSGSRVRRARREVAQNPTARNYASLAREHACLGHLDEVQRVCAEGLAVFPGNSELVRLTNRARQLQREARTKELLRELREAPRPALWRELCEILLESGRVAKAEECAERWYASTRDPHAVVYRARSRMERFFADRRRDDGRFAVELLDLARKHLPEDPAPLQMRVELFARIGAWGEEKAALADLLEMNPGQPELEARYRSLLAMAGDPPSLDRALRHVEKTGALVDDEERADESLDGRTGSLRPLLQDLASEASVKAAVYVRGATALVQGPTGATAERAARAVREIVHASRTAARRLGLGQAAEVCIEGDFGTCLVKSGGTGSSALWSVGPIRGAHEQILADLAGTAAMTTEARA